MPLGDSTPFGEDVGTEEPVSVKVPDAARTVERASHGWLLKYEGWNLPAVMAIALVWRLPSLFDPPWVNDEGTYFAVAQAMAHGSRLYTGIWENKPPAIYLMYWAVNRVLGPSLVTVRVLATLAVLILCLVVYLVARRYVAQTSALAATVLTGLLMGTPLLEGTTANAEVFLALLSAVGAYLAIARRWPAAAGCILALAVLFKAVAAFDAAALGIWLLFNERRRLAAYAGAFISVLALVLVGCAATGILAGMVRDAFLYDLGYLGHGNGGGVPWLLVVKLGVLAGVTVPLRRAPYPYLWLAYTLAAAFFSGRIFGHYTLQFIPALSIVAAMTLRRPAAGRTALLALPPVFLGAGLACAVAGWCLAATGHDSILARRLQYYSNFARYALHTESRWAYQAQLDDHVDRNIRVANAVRKLPPGQLLVWGNTPWVYVLSGRQPATPYTSAVRQPEVPGETNALRASILAESPREVVIVRPPSPALGPVAAELRRRYRRVGRVQDAIIYASRR
jgi:4-amino-4-deoxy-L-arabinose transferase-like glycosyltransferase